MHISIKMESDSTFQLYEYQRKTVLELMNYKRSICSLDMGLGKTYIALSLAIIWDWKQLVIVSPKAKLRKISDTDDSWENMIQMYIDKSFSIPKRITQEWIKTSPIIVINYDMFKKFRFKQKGTTFIFDEIQKAKSHTSKIGKAVFNQTVNADRVLIMSGDPYPQGYIDSFNLMRILSGERLKYTWFKNRYCKWYNNGVYPELIGYQNTDEIIDFMHKNGVWIKTEEVLDLPEKVFIPIEYQPPKEFDSLLKDNLIILNDGEEIPSTNPLTKLTYLRELGSGVLKYDSRWYTFKSEKFDKTLEIIESTNDKIVIFYNFNGELLTLSDKLLNYELFEINGSKNQKQAFIDYNGNKKSILLAQYQSASAAIDGLQKVTSHLICYSPPLSGENWKQMIKRIHRVGQKQTCYYYQLENKLEKRIYKQLEKLENYTEAQFIRDFIGENDEWTN